MWQVYIFEYCLAIKRMTLTIFNNMNGCYAKGGIIEGVILSELSQTEKDIYNLISLTCGILKTKTKQAHRSRELD